MSRLAENCTGGFWDRLAPAIQRLMDSGRMRQVPLRVVFVAVNGAALTHENMTDRLGFVAGRSVEEASRAAATLANLLVDGLLPSGGPSEGPES